MNGCLYGHCHCNIIFSQQEVPFNQVQHIKENPGSTNSEQENLEKSGQDCIESGAKYDKQPLKEVSFPHAKDQESRYKDLIEKRTFVPKQRVCGTVKYLGKPAACSKLCGIKKVTSTFITTWVEFVKKDFKIFNCDVLLLPMENPCLLFPIYWEIFKYS